MAKGSKDRKPPGFLEVYKRIRKNVPGPTRVEKPKRGKGHSYSKRDRRDWKKGG